jgi:hypothetical protein
LGIHASSKWATTLYQRACGKYLFGDEMRFVGTAKYTLSPLAEYGKAALQCMDLPGMEWVRLTELGVVEPSEPPRFERPNSVDLFDSWGSNRLPFSPGSRLISATFHIKIAGCRSPKRVTIRPSNQAQYPHDADQGWIEKWLERRGFIRRKGGAENEELAAVLAVA